MAIVPSLCGNRWLKSHSQLLAIDQYGYDDILYFMVILYQCNYSRLSPCVYRYRINKALDKIIPAFCFPACMKH